MAFKVSLIVPVYNAEKHLRTCLESILYQTYKLIEVILVNDGSTDESGKICDEYAKKDNRIVVIHQQNQGPSIARNTGIAASTGEYVQFVDCDDTLDLNMTRKLVEEIDLNYDLVICGYKTLNKNGSNILINEQKTNLNGSYSKNDFLSQLGYLISSGFVNPLWNKLYLTQIIKNLGHRFDEGLNMGEDLLFNLRYFNHCEKVKIINECLYNYSVMDDNSLSRNYKRDFFENQKFLFSKIREFLTERNIYKDKNKYYIELEYVLNTVYCLDNLFHGKSNLNKAEKKKEIRKIINDDWLNENIRYFKNSKSVQNRIIGLLVKYKFVGSIYTFFTFKNNLRQNAKLFTMFKQLNKKTS